MENRRQKIQKWFDDLKSHPFIYFSEEFREFLGVKRPSLPRIRMIDKIVNPEVAPTTHIQYDIIHKIVIITTGVPTGLFNSKDQCRGSVAVYELSLKEEVLTIATAPSTIQRYNAAVTSACWNSYNRCLYVGLATGCILFYKLSVDNKSLNYVAELDYHRDAVRGIIVDNLSNRMISASRSGKIACFDTVDGVTVGQIPKIGLKITKVAYDPGNKLIFVGTNESSVLLYDVKVNPIIKTKTITTQNRIIAISGLVFLEEIRLLYVSCGNTVFIYRVSLDCKIEQYEEVSFHSNFIISDLAVIQGGKYVILLESLGTIMLLDMSSSVSHDTSEKVDELTTTVSAISSWQKVVQGDISAMRDWLRAVGLHGTNTVRSKKEILELISKVPKVDYESVISEMVKPRTAKKQILLYWKVKPSLSKALTSNLPFLRCCCFVEDNQVLLVGCNDGQIHLSSLSDFFAPYSVVDEMMISAEKRFIAENAHQEINGSKKSTRGLRHQLD